MEDIREPEKEGQAKADDQGARDDLGIDSKIIADPEPFRLKTVGEVDREPLSREQT